MKKFFPLLLILFFNCSFAQFAASNDTSICSGQSVQLGVSGGTIYTWSPSNTLSNSTSATPVATPTQTTSYVVSSPISNANIVFNGNFSQGDTGFTSSYTYQLPPNNAGQGRYWVGSTPSSFSSGMANCPDHTGGNGNMIIANAAQTVNTPVWCQTHTVYPNSTYTLSGWLQTLNQTNLPKARWMVNGSPIGNSASTFLSCIWVNFTATWNSGTNTVATFCVFNPDTFWNGNDFAIDDLSIIGNGTMHDTVTVTVLPGPLVDLGNDTSLCGIGSILLNAQNAGASYLWNDNSNQQTKLVTNAGTYSVTVITANSCTASSDIVVASSTAGQPVLSADTTQICSGTTTDICAAGSFVSYLWNTGETTSCISATVAGNYYVTATDANGCTAVSSSFPISVYPVPPVSITVNGDTLKAFNAVSYQWYLNGVSIPGANAGTYVAIQPGNYSVLITDSNGCTASSTSVFVTTDLETLYNSDTYKLYPNPLTGNRLFIEAESEFQQGYMEVFDNTGKLVFQKSISGIKTQIDLELPCGFYLLRTISGSKINYAKLVKL